MDIRINEGYSVKEEAEELQSRYPGTKTWFEELMRLLGAESLDDLAILEVHPDYQETDEEGWDVISFFPKNASLRIEDMYSQYDVNDFSIGRIDKVTSEGITFIAVRNASPIAMYVNRNKL